ncbi:MAG: hypothetical protein JO161_06005 [Planctomycetaceae bacterium]|nr:hypothetical protein [Planctomycetaceae bacterium]
MVYRVVLSRAAGRARTAPGKTAAQPVTSSRDANSPIMMLGALVLAEGIVHHFPFSW